MVHSSLVKYCWGKVTIDLGFTLRWANDDEFVSMKDDGNTALHISAAMKQIQVRVGPEDAFQYG